MLEHLGPNNEQWYTRVSLNFRKELTGKNKFTEFACANSEYDANRGVVVPNISEPGDILFRLMCFNRTSCWSFDFPSSRFRFQKVSQKVVHILLPARRFVGLHVSQVQFAT